jgi:hypothetical protein
VPSFLASGKRNVPGRKLLRVELPWRDPYGKMAGILCRIFGGRQRGYLGWRAFAILEAFNILHNLTAKIR